MHRFCKISCFSPDFVGLKTMATKHGLVLRHVPRVSWCKLFKIIACRFLLPVLQIQSNDSELQTLLKYGYLIRSSNSIKSQKYCTSSGSVILWHFLSVTSHRWTTEYMYCCFSVFFWSSNQVWGWAGKASILVERRRRRRWHATAVRREKTLDYKHLRQTVAVMEGGRDTALLLATTTYMYVWIERVTGSTCPLINWYRPITY